MDETERAIRAEIEKALSKLGKTQEQLAEARACREPEEMGFPRHLLGIIGSWGDTLEDSEVLAMLKRWNETGKVLDEVYASTRSKGVRH